MTISNRIDRRKCGEVKGDFSNTTMIVKTGPKKILVVENKGKGQYGAIEKYVPNEIRDNVTISAYNYERSNPGMEVGD